MELEWHCQTNAVNNSTSKIVVSVAKVFTSIFIINISHNEGSTIKAGVVAILI
jgi:hypothetical protein